MSDILFLAHRIPFPPDRGDKIRSWHLLKALGQLARVHLACFADDAADAAHLPALGRRWATVSARSMSSAPDREGRGGRARPARGASRSR